MFRGIYDFLSGRRKEESPPPTYTITRLIGAPPPTGGAVVKHLFHIPESTNFIQFRAAYLLEMLGDPILHHQLEHILRDYMLYAKIQERYVVVRIGNWWGEFTVAANRPETGTLMLEAGNGTVFR